MKEQLLEYSIVECKGLNISWCYTSISLPLDSKFHKSFSHSVYILPARYLQVGNDGTSTEESTEGNGASLGSSTSSGCGGRGGSLTSRVGGSSDNRRLGSTGGGRRGF